MLMWSKKPTEEERVMQTMLIKVMESGYAELALIVLLLAFEAWRTNRFFVRTKNALLVMLVIVGGYYAHKTSSTYGWQNGWVASAANLSGKPVDASMADGRLEDGRMYDTLAQGHLPRGGTVAVIYSHFRNEVLCRYYKDDIVLPDTFEKLPPTKEGGGMTYASFYPLPDPGSVRAIRLRRK